MKRYRAGFRFTLASIMAVLCVVQVWAAPVAPDKVDLAKPQVTESDNAAYVIGPQNVLQIKIYGDSGTHQIYRIDENGFIKHALVGRVKMAGLTVEQAEHAMEEKLDGDYIINPHVTIFVLEYSTFSIIGEVKRPGNYEITGRVSVTEAIAMAGGFTTVANQRGVKVMRKMQGQESAINVDTTRVTERAQMSAEVYLEADDVVVVPKSFF